MAYCEKCGAELRADAKFCEKCGASVKTIEPQESGKTAKKTVVIGAVIGVVAVVAVIGGYGVGINDTLWKTNKETVKEETAAGKKRIVCPPWIPFFGPRAGGIL